MHLTLIDRKSVTQFSISSMEGELLNVVPDFAPNHTPYVDNLDFDGAPYEPALKAALRRIASQKKLKFDHAYSHQQYGIKEWPPQKRGLQSFTHAVVVGVLALSNERRKHFGFCPRFVQVSPLGPRWVTFGALSPSPGFAEERLGEAVGQGQALTVGPSGQPALPQPRHREFWSAPRW